MKYLYLILNIATISIPLLWSFGSKIAFYKQWKYFFPAALITGIFFIFWDVYFTSWGIWGFNSKYLLGIQWAGLPIEEWLFFFTIPYACVFTYEALKYYIQKRPLEKYDKGIVTILITFLVIVGTTNYDKLYTTTTFISLVIVLLFLRSNTFLGQFFIMYLIILIPFFIVNGILTGSWIEDEVVWYNDDENIGIRIGTIPIEDIFYGMLLIAMNVIIYEKIKRKKIKV